MLVRCRLVGRWHHTMLPLTPEDVVELVRDTANPSDENAIQVWAHLDDVWTHVGFVERRAAAELAARELMGARIVTQGDGHDVPLCVEAR